MLRFATFGGSDFDDRIVSNATLHAVDVGARAQVYFGVLTAFVIAALLVLAGSTVLSRAIGEQAAANLERSSAIGVLLLVLTGLTSVQTDAVWLCAALEISYVASEWVRSRWSSGETRDHHGSAFLIVAAAVYCVLAVTPLRTNAIAVGALTLVTAVALVLLERAGKTRLVGTLLSFAAALAFVPLALVLREEIVLIANQRGFRGVSHAVGALICVLSIASLGLVIARRRPFDAERALARVTLPALILGCAFLASWTPTRDPQFEMLEAGNAGLSIQQWFDWGRLPFFDTFNVHGLSDSLMGFLYAGANGWSGIAWQHWDFVPSAFVSLAIYVLLARVFKSAGLAFVLVVASPFTRWIFPPDVAVVVGFALVVAWSTQQNRITKFAWVGLAWVALCLWRMDLGGAAAPALLAVWITAVVLEREPRWNFKRALIGSVVVVGLVGALVVCVAWARDVDLVGRFREFSHIASSDQAFGRARFFDQMTAAVGFRLFVMPLFTLALAVCLVLRAHKLGAEARVERWSTYALVFLASFSLVIFTRGLVRHTFVENDPTYVTAFQFAVLALAPVVFLGREFRRYGLVTAVALHALLPIAFDLSPPVARAGIWRANSQARASIRLRTWSKTIVGPERFDRTPISSSFRAANVDPMRELATAVLAPDETFTDLSASPMTYVFSRMRSPHWVNHTIVLQGDFLQRAFLDELESARAPLTVMRQEADLASNASMIADVAIDQIPIQLWHARIFDELMSCSQPFVLAGRWQVWSRSDWAPTRDWGPAGERLGTVPLTGDAATFEIEAGATLSLAVLGRATQDARLVVRYTLQNDVFQDTIERSIEWPSDARFELIDVLSATRRTSVTIESIAAHETLILESVRARRTLDPARADAALRAEVPVDTDLGATARLFGTHDRAPRITATPVTEHGAPARSISPGGVERFTFQPRARTDRSVLLEATLSNPRGDAGVVHLRYGVGELVGGSFRFDVATEKTQVEYVFRPGMQANWHLRPNAWIEVSSPTAEILVHSLRLCASD